MGEWLMFMRRFQSDFESQTMQVWLLSGITARVAELRPRNTEGLTTRKAGLKYREFRQKQASAFSIF